MPLMYAAEGDAKNATAAARSFGLPKWPAGISEIISSSTVSILLPNFEALFSIILSSRPVFVAPGSTLFTVIPKGPNSIDKVFAQLATAPRMVFETPNPGIGILTDVDIILIIRP